MRARPTRISALVLASGLAAAGCASDGGLGEGDGGGRAVDRAGLSLPDLVMPECASPAECDDKIECTIDSCEGGRCKHEASNWGKTACAPGEFCDPMKGCAPFTGMIPSNLCAMEPPMG